MIHLCSTIPHPSIVLVTLPRWEAVVLQLKSCLYQIKRMHDHHFYTTYDIMQWINSIIPLLASARHVRGKGDPPAEPPAVSCMAAFFSRLLSLPSIVERDDTFDWGLESFEFSWELVLSLSHVSVSSGRGQLTGDYQPLWLCLPAELMTLGSEIHYLPQCQTNNNNRSQQSYKCVHWTEQSQIWVNKLFSVTLRGHWLSSLSEIWILFWLLLVRNQFEIYLTVHRWNASFCEYICF